MTWITSSEAIAILGVRPQTLYANVSRGRIRVKPDPADSRRSLYHRNDVKGLAGQRSGRRAAAAVAASTIDWGDPILPSAISTIQDGRLYYRGHDAVTLSETASLEDIATLLWGTASVHFHQAQGHDIVSVPARSPLNAALELLAEQIGEAHPTLGLSRAVLVGRGTRLCSNLYDTMIGRQAAEAQPVHVRLAAAWSSPEAEDILGAPWFYWPTTSSTPPRSRHEFAPRPGHRFQHVSLPAFRPSRGHFMAQLPKCC